jgi:hypothetical protein
MDYRRWQDQTGSTENEWEQDHNGTWAAQSSYSRTDEKAERVAGAQSEAATGVRAEAAEGLLDAAISFMLLLLIVFPHTITISCIYEENNCITCLIQINPWSEVSIICSDNLRSVVGDRQLTDRVWGLAVGGVGQTFKSENAVKRER